MWCIWKSRNGCLFNRKNGAPHQININAQALCKNMELFDPSESVLQNNPRQVTSRPTNHQSKQRETISTDQHILGPKIYMDASWKNKKERGKSGIETTGIGVYIQFSRDGLNSTS
jgi:hypothetical protein